MFQDQWLMHTVELGVGLRSLVLVVYLELRREISGLSSLSCRCWGVVLLWAGGGRAPSTFGSDYCKSGVGPSQ